MIIVPQQTTSELQCALLDTDSTLQISSVRPLLELSTCPDAIELPPLPITALGSREFMDAFNVQSACMAGAMANGISSIELVLALAENGWLASFGAAGLPLGTILDAIEQLRLCLGEKTFAVNLIHSPNDSELEWETARLFVESGVPVVEAAAFLQLTPAIILCRAKGLKSLPSGQIQLPRRVIAKTSRREVAEQFMRPAPKVMLDKLVNSQAITQQEAAIASRIPVCDAVTAESDSGGHTDRQSAMTLLPSIFALRAELLRSGALTEHVFIGAAGGIGTPESIAAAFSMGADYVTTGSVNQSCVEAGTSTAVKRMLALAKTSDVTMAPAADMFAMGVQVQVLKQGTLFPMRAQKLYELYRKYNSLEDLPPSEVKRLEGQVFRMPVEDVKRRVMEYMQIKHPQALQSLWNNPREMMLRGFLWYMAHSSSWAADGVAERELDYQIWCGPAMGAFNAWTAGTKLAQPEERYVYKVSQILMRGAAYLLRLQHLRTLGYSVSSSLTAFSSDDAVEIVPPAPSLRTVARPSARKIVRVITEVMAEQLDVPPTSIDITMPFQYFNQDSVKALVTLKELEALLGRELSPTLVWNYPTIQELANHLATEELS